MAIDVNDYAAMMEAQEKVFARLDAYDGGFEFLLEMRVLAQRGDYAFSERQLAAIEKCLDNWDAKKNAGPVEQVEPLLGDKIPFGTTRLAIVNVSGKLTFIRLDKPRADNKWFGWVFVKQIVGPAEVRLGAQKPSGEYKGQWPAMLKGINANPIASMALYGQEVGECAVCGLRLTDESSREMGIGPICYGKLVP